jgi:osmoprotectant transport system substrate-binding protein
VTRQSAPRAPTPAALLALAALVALAAACSSGTSSSGEKPTLKLGSTNFPEQTILAELYGQTLEANGYRIERKLNLGPREIVEPALESGQIDLYVEYLATMLAFVTKGEGKASPDPAATRATLQDALKSKGITVLDYAPAVDTNGEVVTKATADKYRLAKVSDLAPVAGQLVLGGPPECPQRPFCLPGLKETYGITFKDFKPLDTGGPLTVAALEGNQVDVAVLFTTDAAIASKGLVLLDDDKHLQLADNVAPVVRDDYLSKAGDDFKTLLAGVSAKLTTQALTDLNKQVGIDRKEPRDVAAAWLKAQGLVK